MTPTPQDVQAKIAAGMTAMEQTTTQGTKWVSQHGSDWTKWPTSSNWYVAFSNFASASAEAGQLVTPKLTSSFRHT